MLEGCLSVELSSVDQQSLATSMDKDQRFQMQQSQEAPAEEALSAEQQSMISYVLGGRRVSRDMDAKVRESVMRAYVWYQVLADLGLQESLILHILWCLITQAKVASLAREGNEYLLKERVENLQYLSRKYPGFDHEQVLKVQPEVLVYKPETVAANLGGLLGLPAVDGQHINWMKLVNGNPRLLGTSVSLIESNLLKIRDVVREKLQLPFPTRLVSVASTATVLKSSRGLLLIEETVDELLEQFDLKTARKLVEKQPSILAINPHDVRDAIVWLKLNFGKANAAAMSMKCAQLLKVPRDKILMKLDKLLEIFACDKHYLQEMVISQPQLVATMHPSSLEAKFQKLKRFTKLQDRWAFEFKVQRPCTLAQCLTYSIQRIERLHFVGINSQVGDKLNSYHRYLSMNNNEFKTQFPTFENQKPPSEYEDEDGADDIQ